MIKVYINFSLHFRSYCLLRVCRKFGPNLASHYKPFENELKFVELSEPCSANEKFSKETNHQPAPVAQWLARRIVGRKVWGSNPIRVMWNFRPWPAPTQSWECYGPNGKAGTTQPSFIHFTDAFLRVLL